MLEAAGHDAGDGAGFALSRGQRQRLRHAWKPEALRGFLAGFFPAYEQPQAFARLERLLRAGIADGNQRQESSKEKETHAVLDITFDELKLALDQHARERLDEKDPFPLEAEVSLGVNAAELEELQVPRLFTPPLPGRGVLPMPSNTTSGLSAAPDTGGGRSSNLPMLRDFQAEVMKKSQSWLGRWHTRYLFLRWGELEICKKNTSVASFRHSLTQSFASASGSSSSLLPHTLSSSSILKSPDSVGKPGSAGSSATLQSKRYPLRCLVSMQVMQMNDSDPTKKQALHLQFKLPAPNGNGFITKILVLGGDKKEVVPAVLSQLATFCIFQELASCRVTGANTERIQDFITAGGRVDLYSQIPIEGQAPSIPLSPLQLALLVNPKDQTFIPTIQAILQAGASAGSLLNWDFASQVLFSDSFDSPDRTSARLSLVLCERVGDVAFRCGGVHADDQFAWNLLMYCCAHGDLESAQTLLSVAYTKSRANCLRYLDQVNSSGDTALHIAIKAAQGHSQAEDLAILLVDMAVNAVFAANRDSDGTESANGKVDVGKQTPTVPLASSSALSDSQLVHICDGNGESVFHLALKARLWKLVNKLVDCRAVDPMSSDSFGNNSLHLVIKVGAPRRIVGRIVQLYRPQRSSAFNSTNSARNQLVSMIGYDARERRGNDTPLTLAIKFRQQDIADLLLTNGASPDVPEVEWLSASRGSPRSSAGAPTPKSRSIIGDSDMPLHVAIKTGLVSAASSLVAHGACLTVTDSNGASPLALAIRFGMYSLAEAIAQKLAKLSNEKNEMSKLKNWIDGEAGIPASILAIKAGQLELLSLLLDHESGQIFLVDATTREGLLHVLPKLMLWMDVSVNEGEYRQQSIDSGPSTAPPGSPRTIPAPRDKWKRDRVKSRSDGDLRHMRLTNLTAHFACPLTTTGTNSSQVSFKRDGADTRIAFYHDAIEALIQCILRNSDDGHSVIAPTLALPKTQIENLLPYHLPTQPLLAVTDHNSDACTPLHVAAAGGAATTGILSLMLALVHERVNGPSEQVHILSVAVGARSETSLHAALASNSAFNALLLLLYSQVIQGRLLISASSSSHMGQHSSLQWSEVETILHESYELVTSDGNSPLHLAAHWPSNPNMLLVMDVLLQEKTYANCWNREGYAPLHVAICNQCDSRFIRLFAQHGQDLNVWTEGRRRSSSNQDADLPVTTDSGPNTRKSSDTDNDIILFVAKNPLMVAIEEENVAAFRELVASGADVKVVTPQSRMGLLQWASWLGTQNKELLGELLNCKKLTSYHIVDQFGTSSEVALAKIKELLRQTTSDPRAILKTSTKPTTNLHPNATATVQLLSPRGVIRPNLANSVAQAVTKSVKDEKSDRSFASSRPPNAAVIEEQVLTSTSSDKHVIRLSDAASRPKRYSVHEASGIPPLGRPLGSPSRSPTHLRSSLVIPHPFHSRIKPPALDPSTVEYLREEEKATLTLVAQEARLEAQEWLKKRAGHKKLLSEAHVQLQAALAHRRTNSGNVPIPDEAPSGSSFIQADEAVSNQQLALQNFKEIAAKRFIDKHVADAVADARAEIEREKQSIFQETGIYPGPASTIRRERSDGGKQRGLSRSGSFSGSFLSIARAGDGNHTQLSGSDDSVWWSDRGTSFFSDENLTWLSSPADRGSIGEASSFPGSSSMASPLRRSFMLQLNTHQDNNSSENNDKGARPEQDSEYLNPLDRDSFKHIIVTRNSLS